MPRSKRQNVLLRHDQTLDAITKAIGYLDELHTMFSKHHPEYCPGYKNIIVMLTMAHEFTEKMKGFI